MGADDDVTRFIESSFPSVWSLEVLLLLRREQRGCSREQLVEALQGKRPGDQPGARLAGRGRPRGRR